VSAAERHLHARRTRSGNEGGAELHLQLDIAQDGIPTFCFRYSFLEAAGVWRWEPRNPGQLDLDLLALTAGPR
jgi:hypothetical protein